MAFSLAFTQAIYIYILVRDKILLGKHDLVSASLISQTLGIPKPSVVKILGALSQAGILETGTGIRGGARLPSGSQGHTLLDLFEAIEGQKALFRLDQELAAQGPRPALARQAVSAVLGHIEGRFRNELRSVGLNDVVAPPSLGSSNG